MINIIKPDQRNIRQCEFIDVIHMVAPEFQVHHVDEFVTTIQKGDLKAQVHYQLYELTRDDGTKCYYLLDNFGTVASMPSDNIGEVLEYLTQHNFEHCAWDCPQCPSDR